MGSKLEPGKFDCYENALPDEPTFVLLGRDPQAPYLVTEWANIRLSQIKNGERPESDKAMVDEAYACAHKMRDWRGVNNGKWRK